MPFIDVFSMLNTFLLFSAVFLSIGILEVQIPFLSNAKVTEKDNTRVISVNVDVSRERVEVTTAFSAPPVNEVQQSFAIDARGLDELHAYLVNVRRNNEATDRATLYADDDVTFEQIAKVIDSIKTRRANDPEFFFIDDKSGDKRRSQFVFTHVVMGSVML